MAHMSGNDKIQSRDFSASSQLTNWILDSGATCYTTQQIQYFIPGSLEDKDEYI